MAANRDLVSGNDLVAGPADTQQLRAGPALGEPLLDRAIVVDVKINPHVRVAELVPRNRPFDDDLAAQVIEHRRRMVRDNTGERCKPHHD